MEKLDISKLVQISMDGPSVNWSFLKGETGYMMITNLLQLNTDKTEFIIFGTKQQLLKINRNSIVFTGNNVEITSARNLGICFDNVL